MDNSAKNQICKVIIEGLGLQEALTLKVGDMFCSIGVSFYKSPCHDAFINLLLPTSFQQLPRKFIKHVI